MTYLLRYYLSTQANIELDSFVEYATLPLGVAVYRLRASSISSKSAYDITVQVLSVNHPLILRLIRYLLRFVFLYLERCACNWEQMSVAD